MNFTGDSMIECHISNCEHHICHTWGADEGPFCDFNECKKTPEEMIEMMQARRKIHVYDFIPEEEKATMKEFATMCAVILSFFGVVGLLSWWLA